MPSLVDVVHDAGVVDWESWLRCRAACKIWNHKLIDVAWKSRHAEKYARRKINKAQDTVTSLASQTIHSKPWTAQDPRCCSSYCRNKSERRTGLWVPRHIPFCQVPEQEQDVILIKNLWWKNMTSPQRRYRTCDPQRSVQQCIEENKATHRIHQSFVVCSEACHANVEMALKIVYVRNLVHPNPYEVIIGVDKLVLSRDTQK